MEQAGLLVGGEVAEACELHDGARADRGQSGSGSAREAGPAAAG